MAEVKLLNARLSPFGMRATLALEEKHIKFVDEDLKEKSELLLKSNPIHKKIPVLLHNSKPIVESLIIVQYVDEAWPAANPLLPIDPYEKAQARFWADFVDEKFLEEAVKVVVMKKGEEQELAKKKTLERLGVLEGVLGEKDYFGGDKFGYVDIAFLPITLWFKALEVVGKWELPVETHFPKINAWIKRCHERESANKVLVHPDEIVEHALSLRKTSGIQD